MAQVSKRQLDPAVQKKVEVLLVDCVSRCRNQERAARFIDDLLTATEKVMVGKRVGIALMLLKGYPSTEIVDRLKVSLPTVYAVNRWLDLKGSGYRELLDDVMRRDRTLEQEHELAAGDIQSIIPSGPNTSWKAARQKQWLRLEDTDVPF